MLVLGLPGETLACPLAGPPIALLRTDKNPTVWDEDRREVTEKRPRE